MAKLEHIHVGHLRLLDDLREPAYYEAHMHDEWPEGKIDGKTFDDWNMEAMDAVVNDDLDAFAVAAGNMKKIYDEFYHNKYEANDELYRVKYEGGSGRHGQA